VRALAAAATVLAAVSVAGPAQAATPRDPVDLDVMFIGAHPDDEASGLAVYGAWGEENDVSTGVVTITRGEGGGNAVGPEEGPPLGLLREDEERRAVGRAGIRNVYNLDKVDFYYTVSAPLTREVWDDRDTLARIVRVIRKTRPDVIVTMNPSPTPGNHGHHQMAARLAVEAFDDAADPSAFAGQIADEGLRPWRVKRIFRSGATGTGPTGPSCAGTFTATEPTDEVFSVWGGERARSGQTWAQIEREAQREYASQGWGGFPDVPADPALVGCDRFTQIASRVPYSARSEARDAMLEGAILPAAGGLPLGTELRLRANRFDVAPGREVRLTVEARAPRGLGAASVELDLPEGWTGPRTARLGALRPNRDATASFRVTAPSQEEVNRRVRIGAELSVGERTGRTSTVVRLVPAVRGTLQALPQVADFRAWAREVGHPQLDSLVFPLASLGVGETRTLRVDVENLTTESQSGTVALRLPPGFSVEQESQDYEQLAPGERGAVRFAVTNTDPSLTTGMQGGDYPLEIVTTTDGRESSERAGLNLVPVTSVPRAGAAPELDGVASPGEYAGAALDLSRRWEGEEPTSAADASGSARLAWSDDALYVLVDVTDDVLGTVLDRSDAKRHWRTDSVEIAIDPRGGSENTSTTFKVGVFPTTQEGGPAASRDADNRQGPIAETAPGMRVASKLKEPYTGYTIEARIPFADLPAAVRPDATGLNVFVYDSDTQDKTGQTRLGWSTWGGVQGDPYRWGHARLEGYVPPAGLPTTPREPVIPREAARSVDSPQSIIQAAEDGVALAGGPQAAASVRVRGRPRPFGGGVLVRMTATGAGTAHVFVTDAAGRGLASEVVRVQRAGDVELYVAVPEAARDRIARVAVALEAEGGGTDSATAPTRGG